MGMLSMMSLQSFRKPLPNYATVLPWLLGVSAEKAAGRCGGLEALTTFTEEVPDDVLASLSRECAVAEAYSTPDRGYLKPPACVILPTALLGRVQPLRELRFHCGGLIHVLACEVSPPSLGAFSLDGSCGWSWSCRHGADCLSCPRTPVSPWADWGAHVRQLHAEQLPQKWRMRTFDGLEAVVLNVVMVVFHCTQGRTEVVKIHRETEGGQWTGWSVPGGAVELGKDADIWSAAVREWDEEVSGYPWAQAVSRFDGEPWEEHIEGCLLHRRGPSVMFVSRMGEHKIAARRRGGEVLRRVSDPRATGFVFSEAAAGFWESTHGREVRLDAPARCVVPAALAGPGRCTDVRKVHTEGWPFLEHLERGARWAGWDEAGGGGAAIGCAQERPFAGVPLWCAPARGSPIAGCEAAAAACAPASGPSAAP
ncbi:unnamed protein product [Prorocentrum cordatum]|uniref:Nudix hydrolase domain-containing protein n=1 Tax=Prorocentrum cordatum TaxID=2364126 RepID=A0ABN9UFS0_9DINO|nr:unnamed protein product [Polarella glacialis]